MADGKVTIDIEAKLEGFKKAVGGLGSHVTSALSKAGGAIKSAGHSMGQHFSNAFKSASQGIWQGIGQGLVQLGAAAMQTFKSAIDEGSQLEQLAGGMEKIFDQADQAQILQDAAGAAKDLGMSANQYLSAINQTGAAFAATMGDQTGYETAKTGLKAVSDYASGTGRSVDELTEKYALITRSTSSYQSIADQFSGLLPATSADFLEQAKAAGYLGEQYTSLTEVPIAEYQQAVTAMLEKGTKDMGLYGNTADEAVRTMAGSLQYFQSAWSNVLAAMADTEGKLDLYDAIEQAIEAATAVVHNFAPRIAQVVQTVFQVIKDKMPEIQAFIRDSLPGILTEVVTFLTDVVSTVASIIPDIATALSEAIPALVDAVVVLLVECVPALLEGAIILFTALVDALPGVIDKLAEATPQIVERIVGVLTDNMPTLVNAGVQITLALVRGLSTAMPSIIKGMGEIAQSIIKAVSEIDLVDVGVQIIQGLINGITSMASAAVEAIGGVVGSLVEGAKSMLGIHSPSRVFEREVGWMVPEGAAKGILGRRGKVVAAMRKAMEVPRDLGRNLSLGMASAGRSLAASAAVVGGASTVNNYTINGLDFTDNPRIVSAVMDLFGNMERLGVI